MKKALVVITLLTVATMFFAYGLSFAAASPAYNDEFSTSSLDSFWSTTGSAPSATFDLTTTPGSHIITSQQDCDLGGSTNTAPRILQPVTGDFDAITYVSGSFMAAGVHAGLLVYLDDSNFIRVEVRNPNSNTYQIGGKTGGVWDSAQSIGPAAPVYLKLTKVGSIITGYWSSDGTTWNQIGHAYAITNSESLQIGLFVINQNTPMPAFSATFDFFHIIPGGFFVTPEYPLGTLAIPAAIGAAYLVVKRKSLPAFKN
jgi:regulation of enolase protein 1 (concanavalin A-like superfamily)